MDALAVARSVLAASLACDEADLGSPGVLVVLAEDRPGRLRFPRGPRRFALATMGAGAVVSCDADRLEWVRRELGQLDRGRLFGAATIALIADRLAEDGEAVAGPDLKQVCAPADLRPAAPPDGVAIEVVEAPAIAELYRHDGFRNALAYGGDTPCPDVLAAVARRGGEIVGVAGASADSDRLWQIGVDVVEPERGRGIGRAIVGRLTAAVHAQGRVPYYSTAVSNLASTRLAVGLGYRLAWVELYGRARPPG